MRAVAIVLAMLHAIAVAVAALFAWFVSSFPWENLSPDDERDFDVVEVVLAAVTGIGVAFGRSWAASAFGVQLVFGASALGIALGHSDHSDGRLASFALAVELAGAGAVAIAWTRRRARG